MVRRHEIPKILICPHVYSTPAGLRSDNEQTGSDASHRKEASGYWQRQNRVRRGYGTEVANCSLSK